MNHPACRCIVTHMKQKTSENIVPKEKIAHYEHFLFLQQNFQLCLIIIFLEIFYISYTPFFFKTGRIIVLPAAGGVLYFCSPNNCRSFCPITTRMCIGIISWTSSITSHITLVIRELLPFNYRNYLKFGLSAQ